METKSNDGEDADVVKKQRKKDRKKKETSKTPIKQRTLTPPRYLLLCPTSTPSPTQKILSMPRRACGAQLLAKPTSLKPCP
jgi:hypothetical protein